MTEPVVSVCPGRAARCTDVRKTRSPAVATRPPPSTRRRQRPRRLVSPTAYVSNRSAETRKSFHALPRRASLTDRRLAILREPRASPPDEHRLETVGGAEHGGTKTPESSWPVASAGSRDGGRTSVVCYWNSSSLLRSAPKDYDLGKLCAHCCTHLVYTTARLSADGRQLHFPEDDTGLKSVRDMDALKTSHPQLKLVLSIRMEGSGVNNLSVGTEAPSKRAQLAELLVHWLSEFNFDGVEIDWDRLPVDLKPVYVDFVRAFRIAMKKARLLTLVSVHMKWGALVRRGSPARVRVRAILLTFLSRLSQTLASEIDIRLSDLLIVHAYSKEDSPKTAVPPIIFKEDLVEACEAFLGELRSRQRVALALPLFGYAYRLRNSARYELRAAVRGPAPPGPYTDERGLLAYFEICLEFSSDLWVSLYDKEADCKIAVNRDKGQWIGYDNKATILNKVLFAKRMRMGGIAVVTVDMDDYNGDCGQRNVLLGQLHNALNELDRPIRRPPANLSLPPRPMTTFRTGFHQGDRGGEPTSARPDGRRQA
ncbi:hypothetical protein MTO96_004850 [Rhipicephalus appendiculatus]